MARDLRQREHAILRNFPLVGRLRYLLESVGPELRQYIVTSNDEERPFSRDQRRWVYASSKRQINTFGFGTDNDYEPAESARRLQAVAVPGAAPAKGEPGAAPDYALPAAKVLGARAPPPRRVPRRLDREHLGDELRVAVARGRRGAQSRRGACGLSAEHGRGRHAPAHRHGGELVYQIGTGYFGCRDEHGRFSLERLLERIAEAPVRAIEIKLSQGAKPGLGGLLPAAKVTEEIARIRGVPAFRDCASPA